MTQPVFIDEIGAVLLPLGDLRPWRRFSGRHVALSVVPELPICDEYPELIDALASQPVLMAIGMERIAQLIPGCALASAECIGERVMGSVDGIPLPLCWHHDNLAHAGQLPTLAASAMRPLAYAALRYVAGWCDALPDQLLPAQVAWWATAFKVLDYMPKALLRAACRLTPRATERRFVGAGYRPTGEHESHFERPVNGDPLADIRQTLKAPLLRCEDAEPAALHLARPKLQRWESSAYLAFVRQLPCVVTGRRDGIEAHHLIGHGQGKMGDKANDLLTMPLCHDEHRALHADRRGWEQRHGSQLEYVLRTISTALGMGVFG